MAIRLLLPATKVPGQIPYPVAQTELIEQSQRFSLGLLMRNTLHHQRLHYILEPVERSQQVESLETRNRFY